MKIDPKLEPRRPGEADPAGPRAPRVFKTIGAPGEQQTWQSNASGSGKSDIAFARIRRTNVPDRPTNDPEKEQSRARILTANDLKRGIKWGSILLSAAGALASLALTLWFTRFVSVAVQRDDWLGWISFGLLSVIAIAAVVLMGRELWGFRRLARLARLRREIKEAISTNDAVRERAAVNMLENHYGGRADMAWGRARLAEHKSDVLSAGEYVRLADRELLLPLDQESRRAVLQSAKRVATVTALSPIMWIAIGFVLYENLRMFRTIAGLYGGRPGFLGSLRLARLTVMHIVATGGVAMTDDLLGQFVGQDVLRRLSRRLGEAAFNGALTARLGVAAVEVTRPLPFLDAEPLRVREILAELMQTITARRRRRFM